MSDRSSQTKEACRARFRARRRALDERARRAASEQIVSRLDALDELRGRSPLAGYVADDGEPSVRPLLRDRLQQGGDVLLPRVEGDELAFAAVEDFESLGPGAYGIPEPDGAARPLRLIAAILVPGVAFDRRGGRIGRGEGYYDRALAGMRADRGDGVLAVGVAHHCQLADPPLPTDPHDEPVDLVVTDRSVARAPPEGT